MTCDVWDVIVVPFPFTERPGARRRPALVLTQRPFNENGHTVLTMITTQARHPWPGDTPLEDRRSAGLPLPCLVRLKAFTLDNRLIVRKIGRLSSPDRRRVSRRFRAHLF